MKNFLSPTKFKIIVSLVGGLAYVVLFLPPMFFESPKNFLDNSGIIFISFYVFIGSIFSIIPGTIVRLLQGFFDPVSLINDEKTGFYWLVYTISVTVFNLIFFYLIASWIEWRKNIKESKKIP